MIYKSQVSSVNEHRLADVTDVGCFRLLCTVGFLVMQLNVKCEKFDIHANTEYHPFHHWNGGWHSFSVDGRLFRIIVGIIFS